MNLSDSNSDQEYILYEYKFSTIMSPCNKYKLNIIYADSNLIYPLSDVEIINIYTSESIHIIYDIEMLRYQFFYKNKQEWLKISGKHLSQIFINLSNNTIFSNISSLTDFWWESFNISSDGNTLIVDGHYLDYLHKIKYYNFTDPSKGWPEITSNLYPSYKKYK